MIQSLRKGKRLTLRQLAEQVDVGYHYLSKVENQKLDFGDYPSDALICRLAKSLDADVDELLRCSLFIPSLLQFSRNGVEGEFLILLRSAPLGN